MAGAGLAGLCPKSRHEAQYFVVSLKALLQLIDFLGKALYTLAFHVSPKYKNYFKPTMVTDRTGNLTEDIASSGLT
jgi:hypothetical protein